MSFALRGVWGATETLNALKQDNMKRFVYLETSKAGHSKKVRTISIEIDKYDYMLRRICELEERNKLLLEYKAVKDYELTSRDHEIEKLKEKIAELEQELEHAQKPFISRLLSKLR
ncbi:hypothetical protein MCHI_003300 [Candidatus Magnetoovum chiemensis]|nr:hypothetical protein MCHI_003300 [Candidatus Magnetoovum chiemensis]